MVQRIVIISIFREGEGGGEGRVAHEMAYYFSQHYDVVMLCPGENTGLTKNKQGLKIFTVKSSGREDLYMPLLSRVHMQAIFEFLDQFKPDVIHAHDPALLGSIGQIWALEKSVPFFYTAHINPKKVLEFGTNEMISPHLTNLADALAENYLSNFYQNCDAVVALNEQEAARIRDFGYTGRLLTIPNGRHLADYNRSKTADNTLAEKQLTFIGFLTDRKNQLYLLKALYCLPKTYTLHLIGRQLASTYMDTLKNYIQENQLTNVLFHDEVEHSAIPTFLERTHVVVSASKMEVQSLVVIEALASGTPVVGLSNETTDELVDDTVGKTLPKDTEPAEFARWVEKICSLPPDEYHLMCEQARQRVAHLDWNNVMTRTVQSYEQVIGEKNQEQTPTLERLFERLRVLINNLPSELARERLLPILNTHINLPINLPVNFPVAPPKVPPKTRMFVNLTIIVSVLGYAFLYGKNLLTGRKR